MRQTPTYRSSPVVRSRDLAVLETCDIVIDVGGVYDHESLKYDHHQRGYEERFEDKVGKDGVSVVRCTKLSASGLVYRHYGREVIRQFYPGLSEELLDLVSVVSAIRSVILTHQLHPANPLKLLQCPQPRPTPKCTMRSWNRLTR